jgi:hypothetical protein
MVFPEKHYYCAKPQRQGILSRNLYLNLDMQNATTLPHVHFCSIEAFPRAEMPDCTTNRTSLDLCSATSSSRGATIALELI